MHHEHFADGFRGHQTDQPVGCIDDADGGRGFFLEEAERLVEAVAMAERRDLRRHGVGDLGVRAALIECADEIVARLCSKTSP